MKLIKRINNWLTTQTKIHIDTFLFEGKVTYNMATIIRQILMIIIAITLAFGISNILYS